MPIFDGVEIDLPNGSVGVDDYSRYRVVDGESVAVEFYPWPRRHPLNALLSAWDVLSWHVAIIHQHGWSGWKHLRAF